MKIAIIGLPNSGKTTVFNALTRSAAETAAFSSGQMEPNIATVKVPDERLEALAKLYNPKKATYADVQYVDVAGIASGQAKGAGLPPALLNYIATADALLHVARGFEDAAVTHPEGSVNLRRDVETMDLELAFSDLAIIERRLVRLDAEIGKLATRDRETRIVEKELLLRLKEGLESDKPIRDMELTEEEDRLIRGYQFLSGKPLLVVANVGEDAIGTALDLPYDHRRSAVVALSGKVEAELAQLSDEDAAAFMEDLGIAEPARERVIKTSYDLLGLISFLTAGPDEVRAWPIRRGMPAVEAAGTIHSDIQRGFIRAQIIAFDDLLKAGSEAEGRKLGTLRMEGKQYVMHDGDVCHFMFNV